MGSKVELFAAIRRDARVESLSVRALAERHHVHGARSGRRWPGVAAGAQDAGAGSAEAGAVQAVRSTRCCGPIWTRRASSGTPPGGFRPAGRRARRGGRVVLDGAGLRGQAAPADRRRGGPAAWSRVSSRRPTARRGGGGRLRRRVGRLAGVQDEDVPVHAAAVVLGQVGAPGVRHPGAGGVPGRPRARVRPCSAASRRQDPLRQPEGRGVQGAVRPRPGRDRTGGSRSAPISGSTRSTATPAWKAPTRRAVSRARSAGSAATTGPGPGRRLLAELNVVLAAADAADDHRRIGNRARHDRT